MFRIVHLSDLHAAEASQWSFMPLLNAAREVLLNESRQGNFDVFAFTGDVAFSGKPSEYDIAAQWIENLCLSPTGLNLDQDRILFVPGNHDVDRSLIPPNATAIEDALARARSQDEIARFYNHRDSLNLLLQRHKAYAAFCERIRGDSSLSLPSWTQRFDFGDYSIGFEGFSTSWLCRGADDHGRLLIGQPQVAERLMQRQNCDLLIALTHHPTSDLMDFDATNFQEHLRAHYDVLLRGHLHRPDAIGYSTATGDYLEIAAGALYERHNTPNRFNIIDVSDNLEEIHVRTYEWSRNQWILDRNLYPNSPDGVFRTTLKPPRSPAAPANQEHSTPAAPIVELPNVSAHPAPEVPSDGASKLHAPETSERPPNYLQSFPRFAADIRAEDLAVRQSQLEEALLAMESRRLVEIAAEWGTNPMSFIRALVRKMKHSYEPLTLLHTRCSGAATGPQLQTSLIVHSQLSATEFGAQLNTLGKTLLILDDVSLSGDQPSGEASVRDTITAFLDYCPDLFVLALSEGSHGAQSPSPHAIHLCPLDAADTRAYMTARQAKAVQFDSVVDYDRVHKATGGLPMHIDNLLDAMAYTDLNGALLGLTSPQS